MHASRELLAKVVVKHFINKETMEVEKRKSKK